MKLGICACSNESAEAMANACQLNDVEYVIIDLLGKSWFEECSNSELDGFLIQPPCNYEEHKQIYDERAYVINKLINKPTYPSFNELYVYENKRNMSYWGQFYNLKTPETSIFTDFQSAKEFLLSTTYPIVTKSNVGAGGSSVKIIKSKSKAITMAKKIFGRLNPEFSLGHTPIGKKRGIPFPRLGRSQRHYMICQEFLSIKWEWRIIRIGKSFFGHQKLLGDNGKASGSLLVGWVEPPRELLDLVKTFSDRSGFRSVALDIFETTEGDFYINEIQPLIGAYAPSQMYINDIPGRYVYKNEQFIFEEGEFCRNKCWELRVEDFKSLLNKPFI